MILAACPSPSGGGGGSQTYTATVTGTVQDNAGAKLPGATVSASTTPPVTTTTGLDGAFSLRVTGSAFTLTVAKTCYGAPSTKSITLRGNGPLDTGTTTLSLNPLPTTATDDDRYTFTQKPDGSYKLTVNCVTEIPQGTFATLGAPDAGLTESSILRRLATSSGKVISLVLTEIELPATLRTIGNFAFISNQGVTGTLTIPRNVETIGQQAFQNAGLNNVPSSSAIASSQAPAIAFEFGSKLRTIGQSAFEYSGSKVPLLTLPDGLETIGIDAFRYFVVPPSPLVIPGSVRKIGNEAFRSASGINGVTIRSTNLTKDAADPRLGRNLFGESTPASGGAGTRLSTITTIKLPLAVYNSYLNTSSTPRSDLDAIFGSEITTTPNGYEDLEGNPHP